MDKRTEYTKKTIIEAFLNLLEKKEIPSITVTEICQIADINRATFYRYYFDVYDLLHQIQHTFIEEIKNSPTMESFPNDSVYTFTKGILEIFLANKKLVSILFNTNHSIYFLNEVLEVAYDKCLSQWDDEGSITDRRDYECALVFAFNGALGVVNYWIKNDFADSIEDLASIITESSKGVRKYMGRE